MATRRNLKGDNDMMNNASLNKPPCTINLAEIDGEGTFSCPNCGTIISPDDESEEAYKIVDTKVVNDELVELIISCNTCKTTIKLTGFDRSMGLAGDE
jgi:predicted RNA-binding Zn-ribbon protein involved in translation (DUF1610 family)